MNNKCRGSFTVEAAIIFPVVFFILLAFIYLGIMHYQNISTGLAIMDSANAGTTGWAFIAGDNPRYFSASKGEEKVSESDYSKATPYDSLLENTGLSSARAKKEANIKAYALKKLSGMDISDFSEKVDSEDITISYSGTIFMRKISVSATKNFLNPMGNMLEFLGVASREDRTMHASSTVSDPPDYIRLMDQIWEVAESLKSKSNGN